MGADFSRVRLDPLLNYAGVELQQGRVLLDADANELMAIVDRRLRALTSDTLGRATVSSTTPDAFKIDIRPGTLGIGKGRMYVDGLLAENHGGPDATGQLIFDPLLAETQFPDTVLYEFQRYLPSPPALPTTGKHLVYLDVWDREVTSLEQPGLVENAVGVDASSRVQTVWQVRVLDDDAGNFTCASPDDELTAWAGLIAPSSGLLSTGTFDFAPSDNPCELPPSGGYRGLENQLYRVEIHDPGQPGDKATFKWSRENASVGSRVTAMLSNTELELATLGRDDVLRFDTGDWVEILNDEREFSQRAGEMRQITVDQAARRITFVSDLPLPADMQPGTNLRVRRWDQKGRVFRADSSGTPVQVQDLDAAGSLGVIQVPADKNTALLLEDGLTVSFAMNGTTGFKAGDYWVFAARTADASVEPLVNAPPRGIHHHYARLGIWDVDAGSVSDCRTHWPPDTTGTDCGCTVCVTPESHASRNLTIQDAVDRVRGTGGTVCLRAGQYALAKPILITEAVSVRVRGQGPATIVSAPGSAFIVERSAAVCIEDLTVLSAGAQSAFDVRNALGLALRELVIWVFPNTDSPSAGVALSGVVASATIADNFIIAPDGVRTLSAGQDAPAFLFTATLHIEDNQLWCQQNGIALDGAVAHLFETRLARNQLFGSRTWGLSATGVALPGATVRFDANTFTIDGPGIRCGVDGAWIQNNKLAAVASLKPTNAAIALVAGLNKDGVQQCHVLANQVSGFPEAGIVIDAPTQALVVKLNIIERCGNGIVMTARASADSLVIENNTLRDIVGTSSTAAAAAVPTITVGIAARRAQTATISGNTLRRIGAGKHGQTPVTGILGVGLARCRISGNELAEVGSAGSVGAVTGIMLRAPYTDAELAHNHVEAIARAVGATNPADCYAVLIVEPGGHNSIISRFAAFTALRVDDAHMLVLDGARAYLFAAPVRVNVAGAILVQPPIATLLGNVLIASGASPAVAVTAGGETLFSDNRCELRDNQDVPAVVLTTPVAIVNANRVRNPGANTSIRLSGNNVVAAVANITSAAIEPNLPEPMVPLNIIAA